MCRAMKWGVQVGELPVLPHRPYYQPWVSFGTRDLTCEPGLEPLLPEHSPAGNSDWRAWPSFWPLSPLRSTKPCASQAYLSTSMASVPSLAVK